MNYEALGRYHALKQQRASLLAELRAAAPLFRTLEQQTASTPPHVPALQDALEQAAAIVPRLRDALARCGELTVQMDALREQYNLTP